MFVRVSNGEYEIFLDIDAIDTDKLGSVIKKVRTTFVKEFIKKSKRKDGGWGFMVNFPNDKRKFEFPKWSKYEDVVKAMLSDYELHIGIPKEEIRKRFLDEGLVCRVIPVEDCHFIF